MNATVQRIEGVTTLVQQRTPPLPQKFDALLAAMFSVRVKVDIKPTGAARQCEQSRVHRFTTIREGRHFGSDRVLRDLRVEMCQDCAAVCVRDISYDPYGLALAREEGLPVGRRGPARRNEVLGWYSGARRNRREYR